MAAFQTADLVRDLRDHLAIRPGDAIAVHASMKSIGRVDGGPVALIDALIEAVGGPGLGTVLMPCFTAPAAECHVRDTPCRLGLVAETFRTYPGVHLSPNHTHRVAVFGKDAAAIVATHIGTAPLGVGSPFHELAKRGGIVLHIGCDLRSSSLIHVAEALSPLPYHDAQITFPGYDRPIVLVHEDGRREVCPPRDNPGDSAGFLVLQREMERDGLLRRGRIGQAETIAVSGSQLLASAVALLARDSTALLCDEVGCPVCPLKRAVARRRP
ncbi:MAG: AAC(3) family N-acetyltransferase [Planctomycetes bacterium]|nr:AAC(3) family N-acetyltransferase [Planctomycetota bacterium]